MRLSLAVAVAVVCAAAGPALAQPGLTMPDPTPAATEPQVFDHHGFTAELNIGVGLAEVSAAGQSTTSTVSLAGLDLGLGGWLTPRLALTLRIAGIHIDTSGDATDVIHEFIGTAVQYWVQPHVWVGGGIGGSLYAATNNGCSFGSGTGCSIFGLGLDARAGYSFFSGNYQLNISVELDPGFYDQNGSSATVLGFALLLGYQYL